MQRAFPGGGKLEKKPSKLTIVQLNSIHIIMAKLYAMGWDVTAIAEHVDYSISYTSLVLRSPLVQKRIRYYTDMYLNGNADAVKEIRRLTQEAVEIAGELLYDEDLSPKDRAKIAFDIMDRGGVSKTVNHNVMTTHLSADEIKEIARNAKASGVNVASDSEEEEVEEAEVEEVDEEIGESNG